MTKGMERRFDALPQSKHGELRYCRRWQTDTAHQHTISILHTRALTRLRGGPDTIPGPGKHRVRGPQRQHQPSPETAQSVDCVYADGVWAGGPPLPLPTALTVVQHEDMVAGATRHIVEGMV